MVRIRGVMMTITSDSWCVMLVSENSAPMKGSVYR